SARSQSAAWRRGRCAWALPALHEHAELFEEVARVVRARAGLGVVLHAECGDVAAADALDHAVVEVHVGHVGAGHRAVGDGVVVVLTRDLECAGREAPHGVVAAVVAALELSGRSVQGCAQAMGAETYSGYGLTADRPRAG